MTESNDPRVPLYRSFDQAGRIIAGVTAEQLGDPTPCSEYDVAALLAHLVGVGHRIASIGRREEQAAELATARGVADDGWAAAFGEAEHSALAAWSDDSLLDDKLTLPFGTFSGTVVAQIYLLELTTHSWDLAKATNQVALLDAELAELALPVAKELLAPEQRGGFIPFEAVVDVPDNAPAYDRLVGYLGRAV
jgi:uncharacterized protein (TIGR03086 family)